MISVQLLTKHVLQALVTAILKFPLPVSSSSILNSTFDRVLADLENVDITIGILFFISYSS